MSRVEDYRRSAERDRWAAGMEYRPAGPSTVPRTRAADAQYVQTLNRTRCAILSRDMAKRAALRSAIQSLGRVSRFRGGRRVAGAGPAPGVDRPARHRSQQVFRLATRCGTPLPGQPEGPHGYILGPSAWRLSRKYGQSPSSRSATSTCASSGSGPEKPRTGGTRSGQALFIDHHASPDQVVAVSGRRVSSCRSTARAR